MCLIQGQKHQTRSSSANPRWPDHQEQFLSPEIHFSLRESNYQLCSRTENRPGSVQTNRTEVNGNGMKTHLSRNRVLVILSRFPPEINQFGTRRVGSHSSECVTSYRLDREDGRKQKKSLQTSTTLSTEQASWWLRQWSVPHFEPSGSGHHVIPVEGLISDED